MKIEEIYKYDESQFDDNGFNKYLNKTFAELVHDFEKEFYERNSNIAANNLFARPETMDFLKSCHISKEDEAYRNEIYGMDIVSNDVDENFQANYQMDRHSDKTLIYAISIAIDEDEPLCLMRDNSLMTGTICLKYISDNSDNDDVTDNYIPMGDEIYTETVA